MKYSEAAVEVLDILSHTKKEDVKKIPNSFIQFLKDNASRSYDPQFDHAVPLQGLNLRKETRELLGFIYITWWCEGEEREKYKKMIQQKKITTNTNSIGSMAFRPSNTNASENASSANLVSYEGESLFHKVIDKIKSFFRKKGENV